jgi:class 3 adenylate cyclase/tetratricopeptide (TPR) repeat protein
VSAGGIQTVSVLTTDLVGSTAMAERLGKAASEDLRVEHFGLLRGALARTGGKEVKNLGDGLMTVFASAGQSLRCAVEMQQAIAARNRRSDEQLEVRIGVSLGDATVEEGDYFGWPAIEATRLCAAAEGGQIIVNALVRQVAGSREDECFRDLGALELKGISEPVQAFELVWEPAPATGIALPERLRELPTTAYVGRTRERTRLSTLWTEAVEGSLRLALIGGEAGVGKTRLSTYLAIEAHAEGATVLYGRCDEDLGVPYQPWVQALGHLVSHAPQTILDSYVEHFGGDLGRLVPALRDRVGDLRSPRESDPETERYLLYAAVVGLLERAAEEEPLLLILDDLHWADAPTLSLLRHVATAGVSMRVLVVGAYRDSELSQDHPLAPLLADLHREHGVERIALTGLDTAEVEALLEAAAGHELDDGGRELAAEITRETAGNPFFAGELLRHLTESGAIVQEGGRWRLVGDLAELGLPQSVREVVGRRVGRLGPEARIALSAAAVIGRDFDIDLLLAVVDVPQTRLLDLLDEGVAAALLQENRDRAGRFTFTHALVEHTLFEDLGATRRAVLHRQIAEALEEQCGEEPGERLGELAGHWAAAVVSANTVKAIHYARRAAERALSQLAPDEAIRWYQHALDLAPQVPGGNGSERCELLIGLGEAQRQVGSPAFRQTLLDAGELAQTLGDSDRLCRAVLASTRGFSSSIGAVDSERVEALEAASQALPNSDPRRAQVLALLASELHWTGDPSRCQQLAREGIEIARAAGDPAALAHTLAHAIWAIWTPDTLVERRRLVAEMLELTGSLDDPWLNMLAAFRACGVGIEAGDRSLAESSLRTLKALSATVPQPHVRRVWLIFQSVWVFIQGDLQACEQWAMQALEVGTAAGESDAIVLFGALISGVRLLQGRLSELAEQMLELANGADSVAGWRAAAALALIDDGRWDEARELTDAEDLQSIPWDQAWSVGAFWWAVVCSRLGLVERARELYELLAPYSSRLVAPPGTVAGTFAWALGLLATTLGRYDQAEDHFAAAAEVEGRLGAQLFLARTHAGWARALIARGRPEDLERAGDMLEQADQTAVRLGAAGTSREVEEARASLAA